MRRLLKDPLVYFLILGGLLFVLFQLVSGGEKSTASENREIVISEARIAALALGFEKVWQRSPSDRELEGLLENFIREEVLYREALSLELDRDDPIVRRRMSQKMSFISEDLVQLAAPTTEELQAFLATNQAAYRRPTRFTFKQVYLDPDKHGQQLAATIVNLLSRLEEQTVTAGEVGDSLMVKHEFVNETEQEISRVLGTRFLQQLGETELGRWQGPIDSGFGLHLVNISNRQDGTIPALDEIRTTLQRDWADQQRQQSNAQYYDRLRKAYTVTYARSADQGASAD